MPGLERDTWHVEGRDDAEADVHRLCEGDGEEEVQKFTIINKYLLYE